MNIVPIHRAELEPHDAPSMEDDGGAQLKHLYASLMRRWRVIAAVGLILFALVAAYALLSPRIYTATALVMVNPGRSQVLAQDQMVEEAAPSSAAVDSEIEVLRSHMLAQRLVASMKLDEDPEWNAQLRPPGPLQFVFAPLAAFGAAAENDAQAEQERIARGVEKAVSVRRRGLSYGIAVSIDARDPRRAAEMANRYVELYLQSQTEARFEASQRANDWLGHRLDELRAEVQTKERAAEAFRVANGLSVAAGGMEQQFQSEEVQTMLVQARADVAEKEARLRHVQQLVRSGGSADSIATALNSQTISELRAREAETAQRLAELRQRYSAEHPSVQAAETELDNIRGRIGDEITRITANLTNEVEVARARLYTLQGSFGSVSGSSDENNQAVIQYRELLRDAAAARGVQESFLQRSHEVADQGEMPIATSRIVSPATTPTVPSKPNLSLAFSLALVLGALGGLGAGLLLEMLDGSVSSADDSERKLHAPSLASVPVLKERDYRGIAPHRRNPADYLVEKPASAFAEALRVLRTALVHARVDHKARVVAVTSALPDEGKTTMSLCLARIAAMSGQRVAIVDCDLRRRSLSMQVGTAAKRGLLEVLAGEADWRSSVVQDECGVHLLSVQAAKFTPRDVFSSQAMAKLIEDLRANYDLVVLDSAPVLAIAETRIVAAHADLTVLVVRCEKTPAAAVRTALKEVSNAGADVAGVALNYLNPRRSGRGYYGDSLYYGYSRAYYHD